ncbi:MAG: hypothetical protein R2705_12735 [Ilumatobacteraceae bacterium]
MTDRAAFHEWLAELVTVLAERPVELHHGPRFEDPSDPEFERRLDAVLAAGTGVAWPAERERPSGTKLEAELVIQAIDLLRSAQDLTESELVSIRRERHDADRTVKAITQYVRSLG